MKKIFFILIFGIFLTSCSTAVLPADMRYEKKLKESKHKKAKHMRIKKWHCN